MKAGKITIGRFSSTEEPRRGVTITLENSDGRRVIEIELTIPQFGDVISGAGYIDCRYRTFGFS